MRRTATARMVASGLALALAALGLAGCSGGSSGDADSLRMLTFDGPDTSKLIKEQLAVFTKETGIKVTLETLPGGSAAVYPGKVRTEILGGNAPDVFEIWGGQLAAPFVNSGQVVPLDEYYQKYNWEKSISPSYVQGLTYDGKKYGVPLYTGNLIAWYNKTMFDKAGISSPPTTYAELRTDNQKLVAAGMVPVDLGGMYGWDLQRLFEYLLETTAGPKLHDELLAGKASWNQKPVEEAFQQLRDWQTEKWLPEGVLGIDPSTEGAGFVQGKMAYTISGSWLDPVIAQTENPSQFGVFALPTSQDPNRHAGFVQGYMMTKASKSKDNAAKLIDFLTRADVQKKIQNTISTVQGTIPASSKDAPLSAIAAKVSESEPFYMVQDQAFPQELSDKYYEVQSNIIQGNITPEEAAKQMQGYVSSLVKTGK